MCSSSKRWTTRPNEEREGWLIEGPAPLDQLCANTEEQARLVCRIFELTWPEFPMQVLPPLTHVGPPRGAEFRPYSSAPRVTLEETSSMAEYLLERERKREGDKPGRSD